MPYPTLSASFATVLLAFIPGGCGVIVKDDLTKTLEATLAAYGQAMRWGRFETAYGYLHPDHRKGPPPSMENLRIIGYEIIEAPHRHGEQRAEQMVRIRYVHEDVQQLRSLIDRQRWRYDEATDGWWLDSGVPRFE